MSVDSLFDPARPWDHPYETRDESNVCIHCGQIGSYAHTEEAFVKYGWPTGFPGEFGDEAME